MGVDVAKDCQGLTVHTVSFAHTRGPVFYASMSHGGPRADETLNLRLVSVLWDHLVATESPPWKPCQSSNEAVYPIKLAHGPLGRPHLVMGKYRGPVISFSEGGGRVWAALCGDACEIGIDVAGTNEFQGEFPFHRVFCAEELQHALRLMDGDMARASALLWSIKEAVVKALGCGFHLVDPRHITVHPSAGGAAGEDGGYTFSVGLSGKALVRFPPAVRGPLWVRSLPHGKRWLSIALLTGRAQP